MAHGGGVTYLCALDGKPLYEGSTCTGMGIYFTSSCQVCFHFTQGGKQGVGQELLAYV